jgi:hypothetical protein
MDGAVKSESQGYILGLVFQALSVFVARPTKTSHSFTGNHIIRGNERIPHLTKTCF